MLFALYNGHYLLLFVRLTVQRYNFFLKHARKIYEFEPKVVIFMQLWLKLICEFEPKTVIFMRFWLKLMIFCYGKSNMSMYTLLNKFQRAVELF